ncbi:MAG: hypothetical protein H0V21_06050 [Rubrobacter sp.]|nr:hypothetical protein [Rubrobacter sp.]
MKTLPRYTITLLVALAAFLPVLWGAFPQMPLWVRIGIGLLLAAAAGYVEHRKNAAPHLAIEEKRTYLFGYACDEAFEDLRRFDATARLNIMELDPKLPGQEPVFSTVYALGMDGAPDADLGLKVSQGVSGQAVAQGEFTVANLEIENGPTFGLSTDQLQKTNDLTLVLSMPVKKTERLPDGTPSVTDEVLGVVNVDSHMPGALGRYRTRGAAGADRSQLEHQEDVLERVSRLCSYIMS